ncbi:hypothetical protein FAGAP_185 [Fusarium agapanthi]|uniref:Major facilitator superfamily (MFS) profile domain-containing protein n=1 Tax=Fusarium agapanthi TaxID=1803897 RepID=A0A9P5BK72_9HYPO|nr:hypothetical protein FAGAP_185 [Fusarium agapanthi]
MATQHPDFDELPLDKTGPRGNAWGLWGGDDQLGTLNHLTGEVVGQAARENFKTGIRVSLNWSMKGASYPKFACKNLDLRLINKTPLKHAHDDKWNFNSQCSSQWDGFRHSQLYYMGRKAEEFAASDNPNSIHHVSAKGIAGRGVFIDWYSWALAQGLEIDAMSSYEIPFNQIAKTLEFQKMSLDSLRAGDIIVIRFGYLSQYENMDAAKREYLDKLYQTQKPDNIGLKPSEELLRFLWDTKIVAICGDGRSLEVWPCKDPEWHLHEWLLAGWGMPIGELFYLEELAKTSPLRMATDSSQNYLSKEVSSPAPASSCRAGTPVTNFSNDSPFSTLLRHFLVHALSGLLAFGIARLDGARGIARWRWIFLIEGAVTVAAGLVMPLLVIDTPERAKSNTEEGDKFSWKLLFKTMIDWKVLLGIILAWANSVPNAVFKFTMPQIIKQLGFTTAQSQLLTMPLYVCGGIAAWLSGRFSDRLSWRMPFIVGPMLVLLVAWIRQVTFHQRAKPAKA